MSSRHGWLRPGAVALVFCGGCLGGGTREVLVWALPQAAPFPLGVLIANVLGALLLGVLLDLLLHRTSPAAARSRLLLGTGYLGGFTTYSSLALAVAALIRAGEWWSALFYGLGTVVLGGMATLFGMLLAERTRRSTETWDSTATKRSTETRDSTATKRSTATRHGEAARGTSEAAGS